MVQICGKPLQNHNFKGVLYIRGKKLILSQAIFSYCKLARRSILSQLVTLGTVTMNMMDKPSNWFRTMLQWSGELHKETNHFGNLRKIERVYWLFRWTWGRGATKTYWWWKPPISTKYAKNVENHPRDGRNMQKTYVKPPENMGFANTC